MVVESWGARSAVRCGVLGAPAIKPWSSLKFACLFAGRIFGMAGYLGKCCVLIALSAGSSWRRNQCGAVKSAASVAMGVHLDDLTDGYQDVVSNGLSQSQTKCLHACNTILYLYVRASLVSMSGEPCLEDWHPRVPITVELQ